MAKRKTAAPAPADPVPVVPTDAPAKAKATGGAKRTTNPQSEAAPAKAAKPTRKTLVGKSDQAIGNQKPETKLQKSTSAADKKGSAPSAAEKPSSPAAASVKRVKKAAPRKIVAPAPPVLPKVLAETKVGNARKLKTENPGPKVIKSPKAEAAEKKQKTASPATNDPAILKRLSASIEKAARAARGELVDVPTSVPSAKTPRKPSIATVPRTGNIVPLTTPVAGRKAKKSEPTPEVIKTTPMMKAGRTAKPKPEIKAKSEPALQASDEAKPKSAAKAKTTAAAKPAKVATPKKAAVKKAASKRIVAKKAASKKAAKPAARKAPATKTKKPADKAISPAPLTAAAFVMAPPTTPPAPSVEIKLGRLTKLPPNPPPKPATLPVLGPAPAASPKPVQAASTQASAHANGKPTPPEAPVATAPIESNPVPAAPELPTPGGSRLVLLARDPDWLYAYWDLSGGDLAYHGLGLLHGAPLVFMRLHALNHDGTPAPSGSFDLMVVPEAENWLIQIPRIERDWQAEMGYIGREGRFVSIVLSNRLSSPYTEPQPEPVEAALSEPAASNESVDRVAMDGMSEAPVEPLIMPAPGQPDLIHYQAAPGEPVLTLLAPPVPLLPVSYSPAPYPNLSPLPAPWPVHADAEPWLGPAPQPAFAGFTNAAIEPSGASEFRLRPREAMQPEAAPSSEAMTRPAARIAAAGQPASLPFSPAPRETEVIELAPGAPPREKDFWLWVKTELIIYGATEPDAKVTLQGLPLQLRSDGTFSVRFALPEGEQNLPVRAVNDDGDMTIQIVPVVTRRTEE